MFITKKSYVQLLIFIIITTGVFSCGTATNYNFPPDPISHNPSIDSKSSIIGIWYRKFYAYDKTYKKRVLSELWEFRADGKLVINRKSIWYWEHVSDNIFKYTIPSVGSNYIKCIFRGNDLMYLGINRKKHWFMFRRFTTY